MDTLELVSQSLFKGYNEVMKALGGKVLGMGIPEAGKASVRDVWTN